NVMDECKATGVRAIGIEADLTDRATTEEAVAGVVAELGRLDIAVCNAGGGTVTFADERDPAERSGDEEFTDITTIGTPADCPQEMLTRVIDLNLMTCLYTCMAVAPYMKKQN
ncbi:MAG: SDR family NAD(P)-dependent oxidoreductase, partial [Desulfuromonadales bacterium]|nr:SDR family NAD(P)-dependent oxidoreductase [Desulfuromonadales bacterium]